MNEMGFFFMVSFDVALARFTNSFLMHMCVEPEVRQAIRLWKYTLNHQKITASMRDLYTRTCGDRMPLPKTLNELTDEVLTKAFQHLKNYQREKKMKC